MFGDIAAWMMRYPGGIAPSWDNPAMKELILKPVFPQGLDDFSVKYRHSSGWISLAWQKHDDKISLQVTSPAIGKIEAENRIYDLHPGENFFSIDQ
jgi:alpha-L-rhamnosidase